MSKQPPSRPGPDDVFARNDRRERAHASRRPSPREWRRERAMADWYGTRRGILEAAQKRQLKSAAGLVDSVLKDAGLERLGRLDRLRAAWPEIVGADIARQSCPAALNNGVLCVEVANSTWRYVLATERNGEVLRRVLDSGVTEGVRSVRFVPPGRRPS